MMRSNQKKFSLIAFFYYFYSFVSAVSSPLNFLSSFDHPIWKTTYKIPVTNKTIPAIQAATIC